MDSETYICDTFLFSHFIFAQENIKDPSKLATYDMLFFDYVRQVKKPDLVIILDIDIETCVSRMKQRGRAEEIDTFEANKDYYKNLLISFKSKMPALCDMFGINYEIIKVDDLDQDEALAAAVNILHTHDLIESASNDYDTIMCMPDAKLWNRCGRVVYIPMQYQHDANFVALQRYFNNVTISWTIRSLNLLKDTCIHEQNSHYLIVRIDDERQGDYTRFDKVRDTIDQLLKEQ